MRFIKEIITGKKRALAEQEEIEAPETVNYADAEGLSDDGTPKNDLYGGPSAIQSRLWSDPDRDPEEAEPEESSAAVVNFADLVADIKKPARGDDADAQPDSQSAEVEADPEFSAEMPEMPEEEAPEVDGVELVDDIEPATDEIEPFAAVVEENSGELKKSKHAAFTRISFADEELHMDAESDVEEDAETNTDTASLDDLSNGEDQEAPALSQPRVGFEPIAKLEKPLDLAIQMSELQRKSDTKPDESNPVAVANLIQVPAPAAGRSGRRAGRVKTRLLGFSPADDAGNDPFDKNPQGGAAQQISFPTGWIVVVDGPGRGSCFTLANGVSQIGRGEDQAIKLDFGDNSISRTNHAAIAYDDQNQQFFLGHGGKANLVRLNDRPVLSTEEITSNDLIKIGETTLRFIGFCGVDFDWGEDNQEEHDDAAIA